MATGCAVLKDLWQAALECRIQEPGINGTPSRIASFVQCKNVRDAMVIASLKCWEERNPCVYPPIVVVQDNKSYEKSTSSSNNQSNTQNK